MHPRPMDWLKSLAPLGSTFFQDLSHYTRRTAVADGTAGLMTAVLLVPQAMAYALLAGLPAQYGLYAAILPPVLYALAGSSRSLAVGPVAVASLMVAQALAAQPSIAPIQGAVILAVEVGVMLLVAGLLGLGRLATFISHPVLVGFTSAAAILIVASQLGPLLGLELPRGTLPDVLPALIERLPRIDLATALTSLAAGIALCAGRSPLRRALQRLGLSTDGAAAASRAVPLAVLVTAAVLTAMTAGATDRLAVVGTMPAGLPWPSAAFLGYQGWLALLPSAVLIAAIASVESITVAQALAARRRQRIQPGHELVALGLANLGAGAAGTMPAAGGFSRSVVNHEAGARTQVASLITAGLIAILATWFVGAFATLPNAVLAALIVVAVVQLISPSEALAIARFDRCDGITMAATFTGVLLLGIEAGLIAGVAISLLLYVWRTSQPHMAILGRVPGTAHYRNRLRHNVTCYPGLTILRVDENIYFANCEAIRQFILDAVTEQPDTRDLLLVMHSVSVLDSSGASLLRDLDRELGERGVTLHLAEVKGPVADRMKQLPELARLLGQRCHLSLDGAVRHLTAQRTDTERPASSTIEQQETSA